MRGLLLALVVGLFMACSAGPVFAEPLTAEKQQDIRRLIELTGMGGVMAQCTDTMSRQLTFVFREARQEIPDDLFDIIRKELDTFMAEQGGVPAEVVEKVVPLYHRQFSHGEVKELLKFYQSDVGKKAAALTPGLSRAGLDASIEWGQTMTPKLLGRVEKALRAR